MGHLLVKGLEETNHRVVLARDGDEAYSAACTSEFDALVLDVLMPGMSGIQVTRQLRAEKKKIPVLLLTARDSAADIVAGLDAGADDYLVKPFDFAVLLARLRAISRRRDVITANPLKVGDLEINDSKRLVRRGGDVVPLTGTEYRILEFLMRRAGQAVSRASLIDAVWGFEQDVESNTLDVYMKTLRAKLDAAPYQKLIHTLRGFGYILRE